MFSPDVAYINYPGLTGTKLFRCEPYRATLTTIACSKRWRESQTTRGQDSSQVEKCRGCPLGAIHSGEQPVFYSALFDMAICPRCRRGATRIIGNTRCISCYNREREWVSGKNAKGTKPVRLKPLNRRRVRYATPGHVISDYEADLCVDTLELMVSVLRAARGRVSFGFHVRPPTSGFAAAESDGCAEPYTARPANMSAGGCNPDPTRPQNLD
jgi:hypothetical protein